MNESDMESTIVNECGEKEEDFRLVLAVNYFCGRRRQEIPYEIAGRIINFNDYFDDTGDTFLLKFKDAFSHSSGMKKYDDVLLDVDSIFTKYILDIARNIKTYNIKYVYTFGFSQAIGRLLYNIDSQLDNKIHVVDINKYNMYGDENEYEVHFSESNNYYYIKNLSPNYIDLDNETHELNVYCQKIARQFIPGFDKTTRQLEIIRKNELLEIPVKDYIFKKFNYVSADLLAGVNFLSIAILKKMFDYEINAKGASLEDARNIIFCIYLSLKLPNYINWKCTDGILNFSILTGSKVYEFDNKIYSIGIPKECYDYIWERMDQYEYEKPEYPVNHTNGDLEEKLARFVQKPI